MLTWKWLSFQELNTDQLYEILALREAVFVIEQKCFYSDLDYRDQVSMHLLGIQDNKLAAYLRVLPKDIAYPNAVSIGRVITAKNARGQGLGKKIITEALRHIDENYTTVPTIISAQLYLKEFYTSYGFEPIGEPYDDAGVLHIKMVRDAKG